MEEPRHPNAVAPERTRSVDCDGLAIRVYEWGDPAATPVLLVHGMFDHGRGFDSLAPHLAEHFRVLAIDSRGHGDSEWVDVYSWTEDVRDLAAVLADLGTASHLVGHSRGGGLVTDTAARHPDRVLRVVNIDGFGPPPSGYDEPGGAQEERPSPPVELARFLDARRSITGRSGFRVYPEFEGLVKRRGQQNPRLDTAWLRYFVFHGARRVEGGWRWKADPLTGMGAGPWEPDWIWPGWRGVRAPLLGLVGTVPDLWGPLSDDLIRERARFVDHFDLVKIEDTGHFVHMERPAETGLADALARLSN
jgi:pimeloyl-ACP methyl ester carboxylesterase